MRIRRRNITWLAMLGTLTGIAIFSQSVPPVIAFLLLGALGVALVASFTSLPPVTLLKRVRDKSPLAGTARISADAREAVERANARGIYRVGSDLKLADIGLINMQNQRDGLVMQRTRSLSLDDDGVRPFLTLQVGAIEADRHARVRFEIEDAHGQRVYVHEQKVYLRDGKMDILADHQMPLADGESNIVPGDCDLRVYLDGELAGLLSFQLAPSTRDRWAGRRQASPAARERMADHEPDDAPVSLEDLLRQQDRRES